jgi:glutamate--cysteine ligase catalytic subunit
MEVQMTDFENAAFSVFVVLLSRAILSFNLNFYIPISKVDENMQRAQLRDAARSSKFYFRKNVLPPGHTSPTASTPSSSGDSSPADCSDCSGLPRKDTKLRNGFPTVPRPANGEWRCPVEAEYEEMSMDEIMNGRCAAFPGLLGLVNAYLDTLDVDQESKDKIYRYLDFIKRRSNGSLQTAATWMRNFVRSHPAYKFDSVVSQEINYDLMVAVDDIERGIRREPELLPKDYTGGANDQGSIGL